MADPVKITKAVGSALSNAASKAIRTFHGSPYKYDRIDPTKIGTGEGSAAFGHGFYSGENPLVGEEYRRITGYKGDSPGQWTKYGLPVDDLESQRVIESLARMHLPYDEDPRMMALLAKSIRDRAARGEDESRIAHGLGVRAEGDRYTPENIRAIMQGLPPGYGTNKPGYLYTLNLNAHPEQFLDWDAPLSRQNIWEKLHPNVRDRIDEHVDYGGENPPSFAPDAYSGKDLHHLLMQPGPQEAMPANLTGSSWEYGDTTEKKHIAAYLSEIGVPGIRFLDKFSRASNPAYDEMAAPTRNYVVFPQSSDIIDVVNREKAEGGRVGYDKGGDVQPVIAGINPLPYLKFLKKSAEELPTAIRGALSRVLEHTAKTGNEALIHGRYGDDIPKPYTGRLTAGSELAVTPPPSMKQIWRESAGQPYTVHTHPSGKLVPGVTEMPGWSVTPSPGDIGSVYIPRSIFPTMNKTLPEMVIGNQTGNISRIGGLHHALGDDPVMRDHGFTTPRDVSQHIRELFSQESMFGKNYDALDAKYKMLKEWADANGVPFETFVPRIKKGKSPAWGGGLPSPDEIVNTFNPAGYDLLAAPAYHRMGEMGIPVEIAGNMVNAPGVPLEDAMKSWASYLEGKSGESLNPQMKLPGFAIGGDTTKKLTKGALSRLKKFADPASEFIKDWKWRPLADVAKEVPTEIPPHVLQYGDFMNKMIDKAGGEGLDARDILKAYTTTLSSIQRQAIDSDLVRGQGLKLSSNEPTVRPEGAFADWLGSDLGQKYLLFGQRGEAHPEAIADAQEKMANFGLVNTLGEQLSGAPRVVADADIDRISQLIAMAGKGESAPGEWRDAVKDFGGIGPAKSGFLASVLGRGDQPTLDARQIVLHTGMPSKAAKPHLGSRKRGFEGVDRLAARQAALGLDIPEEYGPLYQHLTHHAIWDAVGGDETTHGDITDMMLNRAEGGVVPGYATGNLIKQGGKGALKYLANPVKEAAAATGRTVEEVLAAITRQGKDVIDKISGIVPRTPYEDITVLKSADNPVANIPTISPSSIEGSRVILPPGDRTQLGYTVHGVGDTQLNDPRYLEGGGLYAFGPAGKENQIWASMPGVVSAYNNAAGKAAEAGKQAILMPWLMGKQAGDSSRMQMDILRDILQQSEMSGNTQELISRYLRSPKALDTRSVPGIGSEKFWPYVESMSLRDQWKVAQALDQATFLDRGAPDMAALRLATTEPRFLASPYGTTGFSLSEVNPNLLPVPRSEAKVPHSGYESKLLGTPLGQFSRPVPLEVVAPDAWNAAFPQGGKPNQWKLTRGVVQSDMTPEAVDRISKWIEAADKQGLPKAEGGMVGFAEGGMNDDDYLNTYVQPAEAARSRGVLSDVMSAKDRAARARVANNRRLDIEDQFIDPMWWHERKQPGYDMDVLKGGARGIAKNLAGLGAGMVLPGPGSEYAQRMVEHLMPTKYVSHQPFEEAVQNYTDPTMMIPFSGPKIFGAGMKAAPNLIKSAIRGALRLANTKQGGSLQQGYGEGESELGNNYSDLVDPRTGELINPGYVDPANGVTMYDRPKFARGGYYAQGGEESGGLPGGFDLGGVDPNLGAGILQPNGAESFAKSIIPGGMDSFGNLPDMAKKAPDSLKFAPVSFGSSGGGGSKGGGIGSLLGPIGAIAGSFIPGIGTALGGAIGSGLGAAMNASHGGQVPHYAEGGSVDDDMLAYHVMNYDDGGQVPYRSAREMWPDADVWKNSGEQQDDSSNLQKGHEGLGGFLGSLLSGGGSDMMGGLIPMLLGGLGGSKGAQSMMGPIGSLISGGDAMANSPLKMLGLFAEGGQVDPVKMLLASLQGGSGQGERDGMFESSPESMPGLNGPMQTAAKGPPPPPVPVIDPGGGGNDGGASGADGASAGAWARGGALRYCGGGRF